ncbi:MAG TPA: hypothetical protein VNU68_20250 [Verrucomicrobiae bacterium]|nr:hypothetical protein [Verrucomicrobiae bacterium]
MSTRPSLVLVVTACGLFLRIHFVSAQDWTPTTAPAQYWSAIASSADGTKLVAAGLALAPIHISTNSGATWWPVTNVFPSTNWSVAISSDGTRMVASAGGAIYTSSDSGVIWSKTSAPAASWTSVASSGDGSQLVALASYSFACPCPGIYTSTNFGVTWVSNNAPFSIAAFNSTIVSSADGTKLAASGSGQINLSTNSGATWTASSLPDGAITSIACSADGTRLIAAGYIYFPCSCPVIYTSRDSGATWASNSLPGQSFETVVASSADGSKLVAATSYPGVIYNSTDAGATWVSNHVFAQAWGAVASSADGNKLVAAAQNDTIYGCSLTAPVIYNPPTSRTVVAGTRVTFSVGASGAVPLAYQWQLNGADLANETNAVLGLPDVPMAASGRRYVVRVSNIFRRMAERLGCQRAPRARIGVRSPHQPMGPNSSPPQGILARDQFMFRPTRDHIGQT